MQSRFGEVLARERVSDDNTFIGHCDKQMTEL